MLYNEILQVRSSIIKQDLLVGSYVLCLFNSFTIGTYTDTNILSTCPLTPVSELLKKGLLGKYISVFTYPKGKLIFWTLNTFFIVIGPNTQKYAKKMQQNRKENGFQIIKSMINNTCLSSNLFRARQKLCWANKNP